MPSISIVNWSRPEKIATRKMDSRVLRELGWFDQELGDFQFVQFYRVND